MAQQRALSSRFQGFPSPDPYSQINVTNELSNMNDRAPKARKVARDAASRCFVSSRSTSSVSATRAFSSLFWVPRYRARNRSLRASAPQKAISNPYTSFVTKHGEVELMKVVGKKAIPRPPFINIPLKHRFFPAVPPPHPTVMFQPTAAPT